MELQQLKALVAIEREGTISAAAEALHTSQPSVSRLVKGLEADLGQELFDRTRNRARLNEAGELALRHAHAILAAERDMRDAFDALSRRQRTVKVASVAPAPSWRLAALTVERFPGTILEPEIADESQAVAALINREAALAITLHPVQLPGVVCAPLMTEDLYLFAPAGHPLAAERSVSFASMDGEPFLVYEQIGFWMGMVREALPNSQLIVQKDRTVFLQLLETTELLGFTTDAPENAGAAGGRVAVPITDAQAHATFFLSCRGDAAERVREIAGWATGAVG